jgi:hypothetical protein
MTWDYLGNMQQVKNLLTAKLNDPVIWPHGKKVWREIAGKIDLFGPF